MHCEKCNTDFPEGLRYCKWCGGPLVDRPRITSELHACPSCAATVQPGWMFCKACGERLHGASRESAATTCPKCGAPTDPNAPNCSRCGEDLDSQRPTKSVQGSGNTAVIGKCSTCGEPMDTGSLYCKACGSAGYTDDTHTPGSALRCGACNSYSPVGSPVCRMCGAPFVGGAGTVVDFIGATTVQQKAPTLPDLNEQMAAQEAARQPDQTEVESGANTWTLIGTELEDTVSSRAKGNETSMLPGTAGSKSEQQTPTSSIDMGRITGPVEGEDGQVENRPAASGEPGSTPVSTVDDRASQAVSKELVEATESRKPTTADFGSESDNSLMNAEGKTAVFVSPSQPPAAIPSGSQDGIGTRQFEPQQSAPEREGTKAFQPPDVATWNALQAPQPQAFVPERTSSAPLEASVATDPRPAMTAPPVAQTPLQPTPPKRTGVSIASVAVILMVIVGAGFAAWWFLFARAKPAPPVVVIEQPPVQPPVVATPPDKPPAPVVPEGMVAVSAGSYLIGRDNADPLEKPRHKVDLPAFVIDRTEVTNAAYKKFLDATGHKAPTNWTSKGFPDGRANSPVTGVTWQDAADYAAWAGKRLPTEAEWEAAARGSDGRIYPWGNDYRSGLANIGSNADNITAEQYPAGLKEVGRYPLGASPAGALDMIGNAWEWAADEFALYPGGITAIPKDIKDRMKPGLTYRVIRGGAYDGNKEHDATYRGLLDASQAYPKVGFRCAKDAK